MGDFDKYKISTQTLIVSTNITIDCEKFFDSITCIDISKPTNNKTRMLVNPSDNVEDGGIVFAQFKKDIKGTNFKKNMSKYFLNSVTIVMKINTKYINIKFSNKGKLQITGRNESVPIISILKYVQLLLEDRKHTWELKKEDTTLKALIIPVMSNINFSINHQVNRELLNVIINTQTEYISILEPSDGYVGVNIKISCDIEPLNDIHIDEYIFEKNNWVLYKKKYIDYIKTLTQKEQKRKISKCYMNTFLVFYSGKVIMSGGISEINRKKAYQIFLDIIKNNKSIINQ